MIPNTLSETWRLFAACQGMDPDIFFGEQGQNARAAKKICGDCPVRIDCLQYALTTGERHGIWGGLAEHERRAVRLHSGITNTSRLRHGHPHRYWGGCRCVTCVGAMRGIK